MHIPWKKDSYIIKPNQMIISRFDEGFCSQIRYFNLTEIFCINYFVQIALDPSKYLGKKMMRLTVTVKLVSLVVLSSV